MAAPVVFDPFEKQGGGSTWSRVREVMRYMTDTYGYYQSRLAAGRDPFPLRAPTGDFWCTADPALAKEIYSAPTDLFDVPVSVRILEPVVGTHSLLLLGGDEHRRERKLLTPPFHGERMKSYGDVIVAATKRRMSPLNPGETASMLDVTQGISVDVILEAVFGVSGTDREELEASILETIEAFTPSLMFFDFLKKSWFGLGPWARFQKRSRALDERLLKLIEDGRNQDQKGEDVLSLLLEAKYEDGEPMSDGRIRDELLTLLMAGHETTAIALSWCIYHLLSEPSTLGQLQEELEGADLTDHQAVNALPYLGAVCNEALRLHPVVPDVARTLSRDWKLGDQPMAEGDQVLVGICALHENPEIFPDPHKFNPQRFIERNYKPHEFNPFGGGVRRCIGAAFALYEMRLALATLVADYELSLAPQPPVVPKRRNITIGPSTGVLVKLERIRS